MPQEVDHDVVSIREWLAKEPHLPQDLGLDDYVLKKFLHSCYGSLEKTKKCIERFCVTRAIMSEIYTSRDPLSSKLETAFSITTVSSYSMGENEILIHQLDDPALDKMVFYDLLKAFCLQADCWIKKRSLFPEGHIIILDIKDYSLKMIPKVNIMFFRDYLLFLLEGMPVRVKQVHVINCPSYYEKLYALVKPVLPAEICNIITFHRTTATLHNHINKKYLPVEYGGEAPSMVQQHKEWIAELLKDRKTYLNDNMWKADLKKKPKGSSVENTMSGSFRTLSID